MLGCCGNIDTAPVNYTGLREHAVKSRLLTVFSSPEPNTKYGPKKASKWDPNLGTSHLPLDCLPLVIEAAANARGHGLGKRF